MSAGTLLTPITVSSTEDLTESFRFTNSALAGYTGDFGLRKAKNGPADLMSAAGEVTIDGDIVSILITSERLRSLAPAEYNFELKLTSPTGIRTVKLRGKVQIMAGIV